MLAPGACRGDYCDHRLWKELRASPWGFLPSLLCVASWTQNYLGRPVRLDWLLPQRQKDNIQ